MALNPEDAKILAREIEARQSHLRVSTERWLTLIADQIDGTVNRSTAPLEDVVMALRASTPHGDHDELAALRAARAHSDLLTDLAGISATLRIGPPASLGYRLTSLVEDLRRTAG